MFACCWISRRTVRPPKGYNGKIGAGDVGEGNRLEEDLMVNSFMKKQNEADGVEGEIKSVLSGK
jgi:hypothetical protein